MGRKRRYSNREDWRDEGIAGVIIIALFIYAFITAVFWILLFAISALFLFLAYEISERTQEFWIQIGVWSIAIFSIIIGGSEVLANYGKINKSIVDYSVDTAQELRLKTSNKGNYKVESNIGTIIDTSK